MLIKALTYAVCFFLLASPQFRRLNGFLFEFSPPHLPRFSIHLSMHLPKGE